MKNREIPPILSKLRGLKGTSENKIRGYFMFNKQAAVFYRIENHLPLACDFILLLF